MLMKLDVLMIMKLDKVVRASLLISVSLTKDLQISNSTVFMVEFIRRKFELQSYSVLLAYENFVASFNTSLLASPDLTFKIKNS